MTARTARIEDELRSLRQSSPAIIGSAVVGSDGHVVASALPSDVDEELVSGMAAAMLGVAERISSELMGSRMEQTSISSDEGYVILNRVGKESVLVVLTSKEAKLGLVFIDARRRCAELAKLI